MQKDWKAETARMEEIIASGKWPALCTMTYPMYCAAIDHIRITFNCPVDIRRAMGEYQKENGELLDAILPVKPKGVSIETWKMVRAEWWENQNLLD